MMNSNKLNNLGVCEERNCPKHGGFTSRNIVGKIWTGCPVCEIERENARKEAEDARTEAKRSAEAKESMRNALIPPRFADRTLENYRTDAHEGQKRALEVALEYASDIDGAIQSGRCLVLCGRPGTGKTHLAIGIAKKFIEQGRSARFTSAMNAIRAVRDTYRSDSTTTERKVIEEFTKPDLVIIDEVGNQFGTDAEKITLFDLINARYEQVRPMIVISNLRIDEVSNFLGERAFDRLRENGGAAVAFAWESNRA